MSAKKGFAPLFLLIIGSVVLLAILNIYSRSPTSIVKTPVPQPSTPASALPSLESSQSAKEKIGRLNKYFVTEAALLGVADNISLYFKDLNWNQQIGLDDVRAWIPASTIKTYVVLEAFHQRRLGLISFDTPVTIVSQNVVPTELETDDLPRLREGTKATVGQLVEAMIVNSDNTAYNTLLDVLDRRNINDTLKDLGITETVVGEKLNLDDNQFQEDLKVAGRQSNTTSVKDLATLFDFLYANKIPDSAEMLTIFKRQKLNNMIPVFLPSGTAVAHKTGDWAPIFHDGGIVYKEKAPFIFVAFSNSNDPNVIAKLAQVAYFQNSEVVGKNFTKNQAVNLGSEDKISLLSSASNKSAVLGEEEKFPSITAADLGITSDDLTPEKQRAKKVHAALITPESALYDLKRSLEDFRLRRAQGQRKIGLYLDYSVDRLSEVKASLLSGDTVQANLLLEDSEDDLKKAIDLSESVSSKESNLLEVRHVSDLHFAVLSDVADKVELTRKEQFINLVYDFYLKNKEEIAPAVKSTLVANSPAQVPLIGKVDDLSSDHLTLKFDDGGTRDVLLADSLAVRGFKEKVIGGKNSLRKGSRVAVVGQSDKEGKVIPSFIMYDLPREFPDKHTGKVLEIDPGGNSLTIQNSRGESEKIQVDANSVVRAKGTDVTLEGIKAGSQVTVFGSPSGNLEGRGGGESVEANTVTVTKNASGSDEKKESKQEGKKSQPKNKEHKSDEHKEEKKSDNKSTTPDKK